MSSSSSNITTTTTHSESLRKTESEMFAAAALRHDLENDGIGAPHIMQAWNFNRDRLNMEDYLLSVEHIGFYLRSAKGIEHPAAWAVRELKKGFYPQPAGFVSWEDEQREKIRQAAQARRQQQLKQQTQDIEHLFPEWRLNLTDERVVEITGGSVPEDVAERLLHKAFIEEHMLRIQQLSATQLPLLPSEDD